MAKRWMVLGLIVTLLAALLPVQAQDGDGLVIVTGEDDGTELVLAVGDVLQVELEANITTGFRWWLDAVDADVLAQGGEPEYITPDSDALGAGGTSVWRFEAVGAGDTTLRLYYARDEGDDPDRTFSITVTVGAPADVVLTPADNGEIVTLAVGDILQLELDTPPTANYEWVQMILSAYPADVTVVYLPADSPATEAGLEAGDVIRTINGGRVVYSGGVNARVNAALGEPVTLLVERDGEEIEIVVVPGDVEPAEDVQRPFVIDMLDDSPADEAGIQIGDLLVALDGQAITSLRGMVDTIQTRDGAPITFTVRRGGEVLEISVTPQQGTDGNWRIGVGIAGAYPNALGFFVADRNISTEPVDLGDPVLEVSGLVEYIPPADDAPPGASGTTIWRFEAVDTGQMPLTLIYVPADDPAADPADTFEVTVIVKEE